MYGVPTKLLDGEYREVSLLAKRKLASKQAAVYVRSERRIRGRTFA